MGFDVHVILIFNDWPLACQLNLIHKRFSVCHEVCL